MKILDFLFKEKEKTIEQKEPQIEIGSLIAYDGEWNPHVPGAYIGEGVGYVIRKIGHYYLVVQENGELADFPIKDSYLVKEKYIGKKIRIKEEGKTYNNEKGKIINFTYSGDFIILIQETDFCNTTYEIIKKKNAILLDIDCEKNNCKYFHNKNNICESCKYNKNIVDRYKKE